LTTLTVYHQNNQRTPANKTGRRILFRLIPLPQLFLIKNSSVSLERNDFTAYTNSVKQYSATYYSIGGGFVVKEERINAKKKIAIKCAFS
jgi:hypothetical protein